MNKIDGNGSINFQQGDVGPIEQTLPFELIKNIHFFVDDTNLQSAATVCRRWSLASVGAGAEKRFCFFKLFAKFVGQNVNKKTYDNLIEQFKYQNLDRLYPLLWNSNNLMEVKCAFIVLRDSAIFLLKNLKKADLEALKLLSSTLSQDEHIAEKILSLAIHFKQSDELMKIYGI